MPHGMKNNQRVPGIDEVGYIRINMTKIEFFNKIAVNIYKHEGIPLSEICQKTTDIFDGIVSSTFIRENMPKNFKDIKRAMSRQGKNKNNLRKNMSKESQLQLIRIIDDLKQLNKPWNDIFIEIELLRKKGVIRTHSWANMDSLSKWYRRKKISFFAELKPELRSPI